MQSTNLNNRVLSQLLFIAFLLSSHAFVAAQNGDATGKAGKKNDNDTNNVEQTAKDKQSGKSAATLPRGSKQSKPGPIEVIGAYNLGDAKRSNWTYDFDSEKEHDWQELVIFLS